MGKVVGVVTMSLMLAPVGHSIAQVAQVSAEAPAGAVSLGAKVDMGAPEPGMMARPTPRGMGVPLFPAPASGSEVGVIAPYGQGLAAAAPIGTPYLRSPAFAGPPVIYMPQTVTRVLVPGATPYPSNIMSPPSNYSYASAPFIRTDIYTSLPYGTFYWPQGYAGTTPVEPQVPAYVTAPASAVLSTQADYTAARYEPGRANAETLNPITAGVNPSLVGTPVPPVAVETPAPLVPESGTLSPLPNLTDLNGIAPAEPAAAVPTPAPIEPFPVLSDGSAAAPAAPAPTPVAAPADVNGLPSLPTAEPPAGLPTLPTAPAPGQAPTGLPELPAGTPGPSASALPVLPDSSAPQVAAALPSLPPATPTPASMAPSLPTPATPSTPASVVTVDDKTPGGLTLTPADAWTPSASTGDSHDGGSLMATVVAGQPKTATFNATIPSDGTYQVALWWVGGAPQFRSNSVPVVVNTATGPETVNIDQTKPGQWAPVGSFAFKAGQNVPIVSINTEGVVAQGDTVSVSVDALRLTPQ